MNHDQQLRLAGSADDWLHVAAVAVQTLRRLLLLASASGCSAWLSNKGKHAVLL
jgi:hypothetical protein